MAGGDVRSDATLSAVNPRAVASGVGSQPCSYNTTSGRQMRRNGVRGSDERERSMERRATQRAVGGNSRMVAMMSPSRMPSTTSMPSVTSANTV